MIADAFGYAKSRLCSAVQRAWSCCFFLLFFLLLHAASSAVSSCCLLLPAV